MSWLFCFWWDGGSLFHPLRLGPLRNIDGLLDFVVYYPKSLIGLLAGHLFSKLVLCKYELFLRKPVTLEAWEKYRGPWTLIHWEKDTSSSLICDPRETRTKNLFCNGNNMGHEPNPWSGKMWIVRLLRVKKYGSWAQPIRHEQKSNPCGLMKCGTFGLQMN